MPDANTEFVWTVHEVAKDSDPANAALKSGVGLMGAGQQTVSYEAQWSDKGKYKVTFKVVVTDPD